MAPRTPPDFTHETAALARGFVHLAGVDEVGRGPLAGPVTAAAVCLNPDDIPEGLGDSKALSARQRAALAQQITTRAHVCIAHASIAEIDTLNILRASHLAMRRALDGLHPTPGFALIDGNRLPTELPCPAEAIVKGDARCLSIAAASIVAKVARDAIMAELAERFPGYGWEKNAGYPTKVHLEALHRLGVTPYHRRSFAPIRNILCEEN
ncbi:ribonuclease HII [Alkalilacustris brevis]|uniref:ribonuclease HII n=1 Tax=Alkalilacustris brevis TaxID=2026338 RepID=UPI000E0D4A7B|nr:ribonuclease HII [Alkalilacustris brevis]